ncbi:MAG: hypothetical protein V1923_02190 [Candidatus Omnitrophota bacterium]
MKDYLKKLPKKILEVIDLVQQTASLEKRCVYLVGGFVRDLLLGVPNLDLDIAVEGDGISFSEKLADRLKAKLIRHKRFGTATVVLFPHRKIDIASARQESYPYPGHLPEVRSGSLKEDLFRRDFTINAMALGLGREDFGRLIDYFHGQQDLKHKMIRILHERSFLDDPTRILRAVRFEQRYGFRIEPRTLKCLKQAVKLHMLEKLQPHRLRDDLVLVLKEEHPLKEIRRLKSLSGFKFISPRMRHDLRTDALLGSIEKNIKWFEKAHPQRRALDRWLIFFLGLADSISLNETRRILRRFAFRKGEAKRIYSCKKIKPQHLKRLQEKKVKPSRIFGFLEPLSYEVILFLKAKYKNIFLQKHVEDFLKVYNHIRICTSGDDLREAGVRPGPAYQKIFARLLKARLDGLINTKEEELRLVQRLIPRTHP